MIRYLVWDVDGTLIDTYPAISGAMLAALQSFGCSTDPVEVETLCKVSFGHCVQCLAEVHGLDAAVLDTRFLARLARVPVSEQRVFPGADAVCRLADALGGASFILTHRDRASLQALLAGNGIEGWFVDVVAGDDGFPRKPDPTGLNALLDRNRIPRSEALMIGDRDLDVQAAHGAGIRACFYGSNPLSVPVECSVTDYCDLVEFILLESGAPGAPK